MSFPSKSDKNKSAKKIDPAGKTSFSAPLSAPGKDEKENSVARLTEIPKDISTGVINLIPEEVAKKYNIAAFSKVGKVVKVAMLDPSDINALNALRFVAEKERIEIEVYLAEARILEGILGKYSEPTEAVNQAVKSFNSNIVTEKDETLDFAKSKSRGEMLKEAPVAKLVEVIIGHAIDGKASDIHIEPMDHDYRVRFRVDGILHVSLIIPKEIGPAIISRIKILSNLKIDEKRKPQDGRFRITNDGREVDFRVSTLPVITGEKVVMRILDKEQGLASIEALGLLGTALENMEKAIQETYGMILFTGPTGSGKSTSLYALLKILNNDERNIITLEDPIEYDIEGLNQSQIKPEIGYTFASGLRTILRQDPNVIMVGEIRDSETAELAIHAALTGHLMFSTLHTNTAVGAVPRLMDMGIEPFLLSSSLRIVVAQRLVRRVCDACRVEKPVPESIAVLVKKELEKVSPKELERYKVDISGGLKFYHGKGCDVCNGTGLKGRVAIYEAVPANENVRNIITEKRGNEDLLNKEREAMGALTIRQDGILKALLGLTTIEEIERVTEGD
ncbi:MAG: GspE/PulE family protein, partial [Candidatus Pacebacteria bacterium]|nr:GspE/PulE family protein [Candidatus Paceibacterota bacterium]